MGYDEENVDLSFADRTRRFHNLNGYSSALSTVWLCNIASVIPLILGANGNKLDHYSQNSVLVIRMNYIISILMKSEFLKHRSSKRYKYISPQISYVFHEGT